MAARGQCECGGGLFTEFTASGRPALIAEFLTAVCRALGSLPVGDLGTELGVLQAEGGAGGPAPSLLALRLGASGHGLAGFEQPALRTLSPREVREWAAGWFVGGNAVLALSGPPPERLRLPLPEGPRRVPAPIIPRPLPGRVWDDGYPGVALAVLADLPDLRATETLASALRVAGNRLERILRHERGLAYTVEGHLGMIGRQLGQGVLAADSHDRHADEVVTVVLDTLDSLATDGPTGEELAYDLGQSREALSDPRGVWASTEVRASGLLLGAEDPTEAERMDVIQSLRRTELRDALAAVADTAQLVVPEDVDVERPGWSHADVSTLAPLTGAVLARRLRSWAPRGARLVHAPGVGVTLRVDWPGGHATARWDDVVGVGVHEDGVHVVQTRDGASFPIRAQDWRGGGRVVDDLRAHVPERLIFSARDDD